MGFTENFAIFICALLQCILSAATLSYACVYCARELKRYKIAFCAILFFILCPWISKYVIMISKDTVFADFVLLYAICLHKAIREPNARKSIKSVFMTAIVVCLFRKNGLYIVLLSMLAVCILCRRHCKKWIVCIGLILIFHIGYSNVALPALGIAEGSAREALSIPFQQTARYVQRHKEEVTEKEKEAIDAVLQYDALATCYNPDLSDSVKGTYRIEASLKELMDYFEVWFFMLLKHPETYISATVNNYYGYFYPIVNNVQKIYNTSVGSMRNANRDGYFQFDNLYDQIHIWLRDTYSFYDMLCMRTPIINVFMTSAFYVWVVMIGCFLKYIRKDKAGFVFMLVYFVLILTALAGPCNAIDYERYIYPCIVGSPILIGILFQEKHYER